MTPTGFVITSFNLSLGVCLQGPVNFVSLKSVNPNLQALAMAMSTVCIHIFGDVPSAPLVGLFQVLFKSFPHLVKYVASNRVICEVTQSSNKTPPLYHG